MAKTALIGPAGERMAKISFIINDLNHVAGRCGLGAVMGSKNLKGIAVKGEERVKVYDPEGIAQLAKTLISRIPVEAKG